MIRKTLSFTLALALANAITSLQAQAGGLWITEFGQPTQGRAGAGEEAGNGDATDAFFNPAAMTRLDKSEILVYVGVIAPSIEFDIESVLAGRRMLSSSASCSTSAPIFSRISSSIWRGPRRSVLGSPKLARR